jgi:outer membrane protein assembly factor BamB
MPAVRGSQSAITYGHSVLVVFERGELKWQAHLVGLRDVAPLITADEVIAATDDGVARFAATDGRLLMRAPLGDRASTPVRTGDRVVVTTWGGRLVALGDWSIDLGGPSLGAPAAGDGVVVASTDTAVVAASDAGAGLWRHDFGATATSAPAVAGGLAFVVAGDGRAHALDLRSGHERWSVAMTGAGAPEAAPAVRRGRVAFADRLGHLAVVDARTGRRGWSADAQAAVERGGPVFVGDAVALPLDDGRLYVATRQGHRTLDPPGRVSGLASFGHRLYYATRESSPSFFAALTVK